MGTTLSETVIRHAHKALVQLNRARSAAVDAPIMPSLKSNKLCKLMNANNNEDKETQRKVSNWTNN